MFKGEELPASSPSAAEEAAAFPHHGMVMTVVSAITRHSRTHSVTTTWAEFIGVTGFCELEGLSILIDRCYQYDFVISFKTGNRYPVLRLEFKTQLQACTPRLHPFGENTLRVS
jgi:hypothetical protein